jgi:SAM-dependent methyltransferase
MSNQVYAEPELYDIAFSYRDYEREAQTLLKWFEDISASSPKSVLELACGPARHVNSLASLGLLGIGLDISEEMCGYAASLTANVNSAPQIVRGDMVGFELDDRFDLILLMLNSVIHILNKEELHSHFKCVSQYLKPNGLYVMESVRVKDAVQVGHAEWSQQNDRGSVNIRWSWEDKFESADIFGDIRGEKIEVHDKFPASRWRTLDLLEAAKSAGLYLAAHHGDFTDDYSDEIGSSIIPESSTELHQCFIFTHIR